MNSTLQVSIIICSYNRARYITEALDSLYNQTAEKILFEVIIVDNNSTDNTKEVCAAYISAHPELNTRYLEEKNQGSSFARNTGAIKAQSHLLCFMDDDAIANPDFIEKILSLFANNSAADAAGGRIIPKYIPDEPEWMSYYVSSLVGNFDYSKEAEEFKPDKYPLESNMIVKKPAFDEIKGFNTALPGVKGTLRIGGEGKDFFMRLKATGKRVYYDPAIIVQHVVEADKLTKEYMYRVASGIGRGEKVRMHEKSQWNYVKKIAEYLYKLAGSFVIGLYYLIKGTPAKSWPVIQFRIDALKGLLGK
jgi:glucosyl-dolichyl phosphate glucuronosyltransferase